jgi:hypothetical protein
LPKQGRIARAVSFSVRASKSEQCLMALDFIARFIELVEMRLGEGLEVGVGNLLYPLWQAVVLEKGLENSDELSGLVF